MRNLPIMHYWNVNSTAALENSSAPSDKTKRALIKLIKSHSWAFKIEKCKLYINHNKTLTEMLITALFMIAKC